MEKLAQEGCCVSHGSGPTYCNETCIRKIAAVNCQDTCRLGSNDEVPKSDSQLSSARLEASATEKQCEPSCRSEDPTVCCDSSDSKAIKNTQVVKGSCCADGLNKTPSPKERSSCCSENDTRLTAAQTSKLECTGKRAALVSQVEKDDCCQTQTDSQRPFNVQSPRSGCCDSKADACSGQDGSARSRSKEWLSTTAEACSHHLQKAFDDYVSQLEKGLCICRDILERLDSCCGNIIPPNGTSKSCGGIKSARLDSCCGNTVPPGGLSKSCGSIKSVGTTQHSSDGRSDEDACRKACCDTTAPKVEPRDLQVPSECSATKVGIQMSDPPKPRSIQVKQNDVEHDSAREHLVYKVSGMTCTSCSKKISNVLNGIDGISVVKVTFVTGIAEFDLDPAVLHPEQLITRVKKETGFKYSRLVSSQQSLDIQVDPATAQYTCEELRKVAESVKQVNKTTFRINYDPTVVGSRDLLSSVEGIKLAPVGADAALTDGQKRLWRMAWSTAIAAVLTIPIVVLEWSHNPIPHATKSIVSLVLATCVQIIAVPEFYLGAIKSLVYSRVLEMDMLVVISITAAYGYSVIAFGLTHAGYTLETGEFFETGALLITLVLLGRLVAAVAKVRAIATVSMRSLQAEKTVLVDAHGTTTEIDARLMQFGDTFYVPAHTRIVTDGEVLHGQGAVDESMLTGESVPVPKAPGDEVIAGTINGPTALTVHMTRLPGKNSITDIANLVETALASKPHIQDLADKVAGYFIPMVIALSLVVFVVWMIIATEGRGESGGSAVGIAITYGIAVLAISCPCALGLAVPLVLVMAGGVAAKSGIIIKQADAIERGHKVTDVVFDKTGTLTKGDLTVVHSKLHPCAGISQDEILSLVKALVKGNKHPVSLAVANHGNVESAHITDIENVQSIPGSGVQCLWKGSELKAGNPDWLNVEDEPDIASVADRGMTMFCVTLNSTLLAVFGLKSTLRDEAHTVVEQLKRNKLQCHIVSGDGPRIVEDIAQMLGIPKSNIASRKKPGEKQDYVKGLMSADRVVLFCGDGTNDAVAVAQANVGVQIGRTSDVTSATADVVLLGGLEGVLTLLQLSKRSFRRITFNFVWSAVYNVFAILLASGAFVRVRIPPAYAGLGEIVSVLPVVAVALSLARKQSKT